MLQLTVLETILLGGALTTLSATVSGLVVNIKGRRNGHSKMDTAECEQRHAAHAEQHAGEVELAKERFTNVYKKIDGLKENMDQRLGRIEQLLDRRINDAGDPAFGRRATD